MKKQLVLQILPIEKKCKFESLILNKTKKFFLKNLIQNFENLNSNKGNIPATPVFDFGAGISELSFQKF